MNIGITLSNVQKEKIWNNGIVQNVLNFYFLLKNIKEFNSYLVDTNNHFETTMQIDDNITLYKLDDLINDLNVLFVFGVDIYDYQYKILKQKGCKIIHYNCGSSYMIDMETVLFKESKTSDIYKQVPDEVWIIPQNYETNKYYYEAIYKKNTKSVPFIWSSYFIEKHMKEGPDKEYFYKPSTNKKNISSFEPNINIVKYSMYNVIISEMVYNENKDLINHLYVTNTDSVRDKGLFIDTMRQFNIVKDGVATFENRYAMPYFLSTFTDIVISHQMYNPMNYAYLDALYLNYPIVHNAYMMKDGGYYYDGFNAEMGKEKLLYALTEHDNNIEEYNKRSKKVLERYLPTNEDSIRIYKEYIEKLIK